MQVCKIPFDQIPQFSARDVAYYHEDPRLRPFYKYPARMEAFADVLADKSKAETPRALLAEILTEQYASIDHPEPALEQIRKLLSPNTFTLITAHQPSLFTGPLYYVLKIISTINLARELSTQYPDYQFVPVFVTGGEDHDFEEVNHLHLFNKTLTWESGETGSVGMMRTESIRPVLEELKTILGDSPNAQKAFALLERAHQKHDRYADATIELVHGLFGKSGLVVANMSHPELKKTFVPVMLSEILDQVSHPIVQQTIEQLNEAGFEAQANPREINFFYLLPQKRERIVFEDGVFKVLNTDLTFAPDAMRAEIENHPERFSPNVIMRPLYQESVFPNLAYIGGGGEIAYWLERKAQFEHFGINFPMLIRRNSAMWIDRGLCKKMNKFGLTVRDLAGDEEALIKNYVRENAAGELSLNDEKAALHAIFEQIAQKAQVTDPTLVSRVWAEHAKQLKSLESVESRLIRAEKQKQEVAINQIRGVREKLFPGNGLQERRENFLTFYVRYGEAFFDALMAHLHPLEKGLVVFKDCD